jgi:PPM family protein phosphatase
VQIRSFCVSDVGRVRNENQDSFLIRDDLGLYVVADGMGGHQGGQEASRLAVKAINDYVEAASADIQQLAQAEDLSKLAEQFANAIRAACHTVYQKALNDPALHGMGTTVTGMMTVGNRAWVAHVGDSRCYILRDKTLVQITEDHSLVNEQIKLGLLTPEEAHTSSIKNIITRSVGFERDVLVDMFVVALEKGDRFLLCSDGLSNMVSDEDIASALSTLAINEVATSLVKLANEQGGEDNVTVLCLEVQQQ